MNYLTEHWAEIGVVVLALRELAKAIVVMTETKKDDEIVAKIGTFVDYLFRGKRPL